MHSGESRTASPGTRLAVEWEASVEGSNAGNGSLMRCAPYAIAYRNEPDELVEVSRQSSAITHADPRCQWSCALFNRTLANLVTDVEQPLETAMDDIESDLPDDVRNAVEPITAALRGESVDISLENLGYVVTTLQAALYHGLTAGTAEDAIADAVMMGGDTDTIGAVAGAVAGARFGVDALPERWVSEIDEEAELRRLATELFDRQSN
nr:ADP-ribosylglycohydrolase family protein [Halosolutus amylolyticus]